MIKKKKQKSRQDHPEQYFALCGAQARDLSRARYDFRKAARLGAVGMIKKKDKNECAPGKRGV